MPLECPGYLSCVILNSVLRNLESLSQDKEDTRKCFVKRSPSVSLRLLTGIDAAPTFLMRVIRFDIRKPHYNKKSMRKSSS